MAFALFKCDELVAARAGLGTGRFANHFFVKLYGILTEIEDDERIAKSVHFQIGPSGNRSRILWCGGGVGHMSVRH